MASELKDLERRMQGAVEALRKELAGLRTGRASPSLLDPVRVSAPRTDRRRVMSHPQLRQSPA